MIQKGSLEQEEGRKLQPGRETAIIFREREKQDLVDSGGGFVSGRWILVWSDSFVARRYLNLIMW
jgi:hypothetical protein